MKNQEVDEFFLSALIYCNIVEDLKSNKGNNKIKNLLVSLLDMYSKALCLPNIEPEDDEDSDIDLSVPRIIFNEYDHYWKVFNPYDLDGPVGASLSDDILNIYKDVKRGIFLYEKDRYAEAIWEWKFNFEIHWGHHAVDAIRALHSALLAKKGYGSST
ncbi:DUF5063 domain-containing protein [Mesobacillus foraminis]|uniref:DUF5063 domain-containing protein n=1 Tax=Mesobacillus foraminis TaxID=279826 RepID=UPI000EF5408B|nr:DUF5063 domain-containing protein [Mesobacillus foraminis]